MKTGHRPQLCVLGFLALALVAPPLATAEGIEVDGSIRARSHILLNHDFDGATDDKNNYATLRTRVGFYSTIGEYASAYVQLQDSRVLGEPKDTETSLEQVDLHQGILHIHNAFNVPLDFQFGRMEMAYGQHRQIGDQDWFEVGRSFDGALLMYDIEDFGWFHFFAMKIKETGGIQTGVNDGDGITRVAGVQNPERAFLGGYLHYDMTEEAALEAYLFDSYEDNGEPGVAFDPMPEMNARTAAMFTAGGRLRWNREGSSSNLRLYGEGAYQFGTAPEIVVDATGRLKNGADVAAYGVVAGIQAETSSSIDGWAKLEFNLASGDDTPGPARLPDGSLDPSTKDENKTYRQLFPSAHPVLGYMDFVGWQNISAFTIEAGVNPDDAWKLWASFHLFSLVEPADTWYGVDGRPFRLVVTHADGRRREVDLAGRGSPDFDSGLGQEIDVSIGFRPEENLNFEAHFGAWLPGKWQEQAFHQLKSDPETDPLIGTADPSAEPASLDTAYTVYLLAEVSW